MPVISYVLINLHVFSAMHVILNMITQLILQVCYSRHKRNTQTKTAQELSGKPFIKNFDVPVFLKFQKF